MYRTNLGLGPRLGLIVIVGLCPVAALPQTPVEPPDPTAVCNRTGAIHRMFHHTAHTLQDKAIGYPETFIEPPLGAYVNEQFAMHISRADVHRFTFYRTDFLPGTNKFSPTGASRFNIMLNRLPSSLMPVTIEWTPDQPGLDQSRRQAVLATLEKFGRPIVAERVLIGPSPYPGAMGIEAANNFTNTIVRTQSSAPNFTLPPTESASSGVR
jgi:hypothetical protein